MPQLSQDKIEEFISLVQSRPALYNFTLDEFTNKELTEKLWKEIAHEFNTNVDYCKTKWGILRVSFARQMRNEKKNANRSSEALINDWYLKDNMSFMRNYMRRWRKQNSGENYKNDSTLTVKTENNLSNSSVENVEIKNEPLDEDENEGIECWEILVDDDVSELKSDFVSIASSSPLSNSETVKIEIEDRNTLETSHSVLSTGSSQKRKRIEEDQSSSFSNKITKETDQCYEPSIKREAMNSEDLLLLSSRSSIKEEEDLSLTTSFDLKEDPIVAFFKSIIPDFKMLTGRRQRILKQKVMGELHILLDEQENELSG